MTKELQRGAKRSERAEEESEQQRAEEKERLRVKQVKLAWERQSTEQERRDRRLQVGLALIVSFAIVCIVLLAIFRQ